MERYLEEIYRPKFQGITNTPISTSYSPEINTSPELDPKASEYYIYFIGMLRWMVELDRVDICLEVSIMYSHMEILREGHLEQVFHIFSYLRNAITQSLYFIR